MYLYRGLLFACALAVFNQSFASISLPKPYVAYDRSQRSVKMVSGYGQGLFPARVNQNALAIGLRLNDYFGVEGGWTFSEVVTRTAILVADTIQLGVLQGGAFPADFTVAQSSLRFRSVNIDLVGYIPTSIACTDIILKAGMEASKITAVHQPVATEGGVFDQGEQDASRRVFSTRRVVPKLAVGVQYQLLDSLAVRALVGYTFSSKFKNMVPKNASSPARISFKNNTIYGLGLVFQF